MGEMWSASRRHLIEHARRLRGAVADLAAGDNLISQWCFGIEEPGEPQPRHLIDAYPAMVDAWVFGHFAGMLDVPRQADATEHGAPATTPPGEQAG
ncbi:hypothetical protein [Embleya sp. NPDC005575]|uniref:hypothetical protein n=1 Tax=Embleya sp. NPDC005575 TaxID=3156892 RepID=UPI0033A2BC53